MLKYIIKRILYMIPVLLGVLLILFILSEITPGDPANLVLDSSATDAQRVAWREEQGLNDPLPIRFGRYVLNVLHGDLGNSYKSGQPVFEEIRHRLPISIMFAFFSVVLGIIVGVPLGVLSALKQNTWIDTLLIVVSMLFISIPMFCLGLVLIYIFSVKLNMFPAYGVESVRSLVLPMIVVVAFSAATYIRVARSSMLEAMRQDYILTARSKGQKERIIIFYHMLGNALIPVIAQIGNDFGVQLGGALVLETVFGIPGIGKYIADSITAHNYPSVLGGIFILALLVSMVNLFVDLGYAMVDPRQRTSFGMGERSKRVKILQEKLKT